MASEPRRVGVPLDAEQIAYELGLRGLTARAWSRVSGVPEVTISKARHGRPVTDKTLRRLTAGLIQSPILAGPVLVKKYDREATVPAVAEEASASGRPATV